MEAPKKAGELAKDPPKHLKTHQDPSKTSEERSKTAHAGPNAPT